jgi:hypothetical protein
MLTLHLIKEGRGFFYGAVGGLVHSLVIQIFSGSFDLNGYIVTG